MNASGQKRLESLKSLGHWIGDIHQPLHVSFADDRGGNEIDTHERCSNLHAVWDTCMVEKRLGTDAKRIAETLRGQITDSQRAEGKASTPVGWANETYHITISEPVSYCVKKEGACQYDSTHTTPTQGMAHKWVAVDQAYVDKNGPALELQLKKAGVPLAKRLDDTLEASE